MEELEHIKETLSQHGYEYIHFLGKGGFSNVLLCQSKKYNQNFAIKRAIKHHLTEDEYNHLVNLNHTNIIKLYDSFTDDHAQYLVMEYCPNGTIFDKRKLSYEKFKEYAKQILEAISFCHSNNIAHRDIKPENIFLDQYDHIKLADFGMAKLFEDDTKSTEKCGSLMYTAPEFFLHQEICPFKADVWALGITFFYMATGSFPFRYKSREELMQLISKGEIDFFYHEIPPKVQYLIKKMTIKDPYNRPTIDKLLEMPLFSSKSQKNQILISKSSQKISIPRFKTQSNIKAYKSVAFDSHMQIGNNFSITRNSSNEPNTPITTSSPIENSPCTDHNSQIGHNLLLDHKSPLVASAQLITPPLTPDTHSTIDHNPSSNEIAKKQNIHKDINSYRRVNLYPRIRRINGRFSHINSF